MYLLINWNLEFCFSKLQVQPRSSYTQLRFTSTGKPIKLVAVNFPESVFSKDFWQACPEVFLTVLLSIPSGLIFKVWKDMGSLKLSMKPEITFFFFLSFSSPEEQYFIFGFQFIPNKQYSYYCRLIQKYLVFCTIVFSGFKSDSGSFYTFFWRTGHLKSLLFILKSGCT